MNRDLCEKLTEVAEALDYVSPICNGLHDSAKRHEWANNLRQAISLLKREGMVWVPCADRLPEEDSQAALVFRPSEGTEISKAWLWTVGEHQHRAWRNYAGWIDQDRWPTHWMPLPNPPAPNDPTQPL